MDVIVVQDSGPSPGGRQIDVVLSFARDGGRERFHDYVAGQFNRS